MVKPVNVNRLLSSILSSHEVVAVESMAANAIAKGMKSFFIIVAALRWWFYDSL